jgi:hypothetical protein
MGHKISKEKSQLWPYAFAPQWPHSPYFHVMGCLDAMVLVQI